MLYYPMQQSNLIFCPSRDHLEQLATDAIKKGKFNPADVFYLREKEGANTIQVAETLKLTQQATLASVGAQKLFIIIDASNMTLASQNKLLKTLEESREDNVFLLLATNEEKILPTIKSRCVKSFKLPSEIALRSEDISGHKNQSEINGPPQQARQIARHFLQCKTLDEALKLIPSLTIEEISNALKDSNLPIQKKSAIMKTLAIINRNVGANCNPTNAFDLLLMELFE